MFEGFFWRWLWEQLRFSMQDVILEPYGGEILAMSVSETTLLTTFSSSGAFLAFGVAAYILNKNINPNRLAAFGALVGIVGFSFIVFSEPTKMIEFFIVGVFLNWFWRGLVFYILSNRSDAH